MTFDASWVGFVASMHPVRLSFGTGQYMLAGTVHCPRVVVAAHPPAGRSPAPSCDPTSMAASPLDSGARSNDAASWPPTPAASFPPAPLVPAVPVESEALLAQPASTGPMTIRARAPLRGAL